MQSFLYLTYAFYYLLFFSLFYNISVDLSHPVGSSCLRRNRINKVFLLRPNDESKFTFDQAQQSDCFDEPTSAILRVSRVFYGDEKEPW